LISTSILEASHQATTDCASYRALAAFPVLCWLYTFANRCHAIEVWLGIPPWISYFSEPDMPGNQVHESFLLLAALIGFGLVCPIADILRPASRQGWFRRWLQYLGRSIAMVWITVLIVSTEPAVQECSCTSQS
jgi:hypothetical protein